MLCIRITRRLLVILLFSCLLHGSHEAGAQAIPKDQAVRIVEKKDGDHTTLHASLTNCTEATITLTMRLNNMTPSRRLPLTADAGGRREFDLVTVSPTDPTRSWSYNFNHDWRLGGRGDVKTSSFVYALPYVGERHAVIQGYLGRFSHQQGSDDEYAIDWDMPEGTTVCAARAGTVVAVRWDSNVGGPDPAFKNAANYVFVKHDDGTFAKYVQLLKDGVLVKLGEKVKAGQPLGLSGATGFASGPLLDFAVFCNIDGMTRRTIPVQFRTPTGEIVTPKEGSTY